MLKFVVGFVLGSLLGGVVVHAQLGSNVDSNPLQWMFMQQQFEAIQPRVPPPTVPAPVPTPYGWRNPC